MRRIPIVVGPDERREAPVEFWALDREQGLLVWAHEPYEEAIQVTAWSRARGEAFRFVEEMHRAVEECALVHGRAIRLAADDYTFLSFRPPPVEPRHGPEAEAAASSIKAFLAERESGEHFGTLWHGPPGNGKTSLVRRLLRESEGVTRIWVDPAAMESHNLEKTFALLARILRSLDEDARALVVFEDLDLVAGDRQFSPVRVWLSGLDGVEQYRCRVAFVALTNVEPREFDPAVVRPARLGDLVVEFGPPDRERRRLILGDHLGGVMDADALEVLADRSRGFSGAEIELLCRRARWGAREDQATPVALAELVREIRPRSGSPTLGFRRDESEAGAAVPALSRRD